MSGWTDKAVIAQMEAVDRTDEWTKAFELCDNLDKSPDIMSRTIGAVSRPLNVIAREITMAARSGDHLRSIAMTDGMIIALASCYAAMLDTPDPAAGMAIKRRFEQVVELSRKDRGRK